MSESMKPQRSEHLSLIPECVKRKIWADEISSNQQTQLCETESFHRQTCFSGMTLIRRTLGRAQETHRTWLKKQNVPATFSAATWRIICLAISSACDVQPEFDYGAKGQIRSAQLQTAGFKRQTTNLSTTMTTSLGHLQTRTVSRDPPSSPSLALTFCSSFTANPRGTRLGAHDSWPPERTPFDEWPGKVRPLTGMKPPPSQATEPKRQLVSPRVQITTVTVIDTPHHWILNFTAGMESKRRLKGVGQRHR